MTTITGIYRHMYQMIEGAHKKAKVVDVTFPGNPFAFEKQGKWWRKI